MAKQKYWTLVECESQAARTQSQLDKLLSKREAVDRKGAELDAQIAALRGNTASTTNGSTAKATISIRNVPLTWTVNPKTKKKVKKKAKKARRKKATKKRPAKTKRKVRRDKSELADYVRQQVTKRTMKVETLAKRAAKVGFKSKNMVRAIRTAANRTAGLHLTKDDKIRSRKRSR